MARRGLTGRLAQALLAQANAQASGIPVIRRKKRTANPMANMGEFLFTHQCAEDPVVHQKPLVQYFFARELDRKWRFDFAWPDHKIAVEIDGGVWTQGAHAHPLDIERNMSKGNDAARLGWRVLHFQPKQVKNGEAIAFLRIIFGGLAHDTLRPARTVSR